MPFRVPLVLRERCALALRPGVWRRWLADGHKVWVLPRKLHLP